MNVHMMFSCIEPPVKGGRPFEKKYFRMMRMCVHTLLRSGFAKEKVTCIVANEDHAVRMHEQFGVNTKLCPVMPKEFDGLLKKNIQNYFFYKPVSINQCMPKPIDNNTVMAFCDVDALFLSDPTSLILEQTSDVWAMRGIALPRERDNPPERYYSPRRTYEDLTEYFWEAGGGAIAHLVLKYNIPLPRTVLYTGMIAIKPHVYEQLIKTWYEMCLEVVDRDDLLRGDQEILSAAVWHLGLTHVNAPKRDTRKVCRQYGGIDKKQEMLDVYKKRFS